MKTKELKIYKEDQYLSAALKIIGESSIPSNIILHKTLCGLGATYMEIDREISKRHSIIIEPNVPVILGKEKEHENILAVWEDCTRERIKKYFRSDVQYKKILTTPEGFRKIERAAKEVGINIYKNYFCLFDECEKIIQDTGFRRDISNPISSFFQFDNKAFVSATPIIPSDPRFKDQGFHILKIDPQYNYKKDLNLIITNNYDIEVANYFAQHRDSKCICVFINSTKSIDEIIHTLNLSSESKVFCSKDAGKKLKEKKYENVFENLDLPLAKYNFFTSRFYSAVDIKLGRIRPDILMLTNHNNAEYTTIDPHTEAIQIYGRFRNGFNSLTHITTFKEQPTYSKEEINNYIEVLKNQHRVLKSTTPPLGLSPLLSRAYQEDLDRMGYSKFLNNRNEFNHFIKDNLYDEERIKKYYLAPENILQAYSEVSHFNVIPHIDVVEEELDFFKIKHLTAKKKRIEIVQQLDKIESDFLRSNSLDKNYYIGLLRKEDELIVEAYYSIGRAEIIKCDYDKTRIEKKLENYKTEKRMFSHEIAALIHNNFASRERTPIIQERIQKELQSIFDNNGIIYQVKLNTIEEYYSDFTKYKKKPYSYTLNVRKTMGDIF